MPAKPRVVLTAFSVRHYRSIKATAFDPNRNLSVLIGPNGSGKTNLLHSMRLLGSANAERGESVPKSRPSRCDISATFVLNRKEVQQRTRIVLAPSERNQDVVAGADQEWNFRSITGKDAWVSFPVSLLDPRYRHYRFLSHYRYNPYQRLSTRAGRPLWRDLQHYLAKNVPPVALQLAATIGGFCSSITYYSASQFTNPTRSPSSFEIEEGGRVLETLAESGPHLTFISSLHRTFKNNKRLYHTYLGLVGPRGLGLVDSIEWKPIVLSTGSVDVRTGGRVVRRRKRRVLIVPVISLRRSRLSFSQLSEGTFRTLALVFYLLTDDSQLLLIEEPEVCVHHGLMRSIIEIIKAYSKRKQIIISTHSELVLDFIGPDNVFIVTNRPVQGTRVRPLSRSMPSRSLEAMKEYLLSSGTLGEYWTHGGFS